MKLDASDAGMGDAIVAAWIAAGMIADGRQCEVWPGEIRCNRDVLEILGIPIAVDGDYAIPLVNDFGGPWHHELRIGGSIVPRPMLWAKVLGVKALPIRPTCALDDESIESGSGLWKAAGDKKRVLLFPRSSRPTRIWPLAHWIRLADQLEAAGVYTYAMDSGPKFLKAFPHFAFGFNMKTIAAAMLKADLVIANDSGPAHLAGTLDVPTLGIVGACNPQTLWGHMPNVQSISTTRLSCVGCHWKPERGFSRACDRGCEALNILSTSEVLDQVERMLI